MESRPCLASNPQADFFRVSFLFCMLMSAWQSDHARFIYMAWLEHFDLKLDKSSCCYQSVGVVAVVVVAVVVVGISSYQMISYGCNYMGGGQPDPRVITLIDPLNGWWVGNHMKSSKVTAPACLRFSHSSLVIKLGLVWRVNSLICNQFYRWPIYLSIGIRLMKKACFFIGFF